MRNDQTQRTQSATAQEITAARSLLVSGLATGFAAMLNNDVPEIGARRGDVLYLQWSGKAPKARGVVRALTLADYEMLHEYLYDANGPFSSLLPGTSERDESCGDEVGRFLMTRRGWGRRNKVWTPRLFLVKPFDLVAEVSEPIRARSDDGALFDLLASVGCRMPALVQ
jgi:hypothetical protein